MATFRTTQLQRTNALVQPNLGAITHASQPPVRPAPIRRRGTGSTIPALKPAAAAAVKKVDVTVYHVAGSFDRAKLGTAYASQFSKVSHYNPASLPNLNALVGYMEADTAITDIRWMAYLLATAFWETAVIVRETVPLRNKKTGKALTDAKGQPLTKQVKKWMTLTPVEESGHGAGRDYTLPAKVTALPDGTVRVVEYDGDTFVVDARGNARGSKGAKRGVGATEQVDADYTADTGTAHSYYGRGYVQLTWWNNYATSGVQIGLGLALLLDPEKALEPATAYALMSHGMRTGDGFANGRKFSDYIHGEQCDYSNARKMVNGGDEDSYAPIARLASRFEAVLLEARTW